MRKFWISSRDRIFPTGGMIPGHPALTRLTVPAVRKIRVQAGMNIVPMANGKKLYRASYMVNKARLSRRLWIQAEDKKINGITDLREELQ